jgi:hypothetical protein
MSFVSIVASESLISVMADGRVTTNGKPSMENFQKFEKVDNKFVAFTGSTDFCLPLKNTVVKMLKAGYDFDSIANIVDTEIKSIRQSNGKTNIAFGGINFEGDIEYHTFSSSNGTREKVKPVANDARYHFLFGDRCNINLDERFKSLVEEANGNVGIAQMNLNKEVSNIDDTVNDTVFHLVIRK